MPSQMTTTDSLDAQDVYDGYQCVDGIYRPLRGVHHRDEEYDTLGFDLLRDMQERHFWFRGRRRFIADMLWRYVQKPSSAEGSTGRRLIDLGGGCGGWLSYLLSQTDNQWDEAALADSSVRALTYAREQLSDGTGLYQCDLMDLQWRNRWDVVTLLDVLEHIPDEVGALAQIRESLTPGGYLFLTMPALQAFWSWNDEICGHQRRYSRQHLQRVATSAGFEFVDARYFMFFLSPLYLATRLVRQPNISALSHAEKWQLMERSHRVPSGPVNRLLEAVFACETPLGRHLRFPWGTSILGVLRKPCDSAAMPLHIHQNWKRSA